MARKIDFNDPNLEAVKEFIRMILISALPILVVQLEAGVFDPKGLLLAVVISALKALDKYLYVAKSENIVTETLKLEGVK